ncbi:hypothetical protein N7449_006981 [Penicillium cf. viridicatum]|uniref:Uncharacterized protein n=1 Tax=Penicillium cf. viridicatum TaxID=2972119 RepID=A0A9W9JHK6_9EURO|nr:hypothetical protein N7449_006981 [Penicillium cf. viridicatum]
MDEAGRDAEDGGHRIQTPEPRRLRGPHPPVPCFTFDDSAVSRPGPRNIHWPISRASNSWLQAIIYGFAR